MQGQCCGHFSRLVFGNPLFEAAGGKTVFFADLEGEGQRRYVVAYPLGGFAEPGSDLIDIQ